MIIRLRSKVGVWRHECSPSTKLSEMIAKLEHQKACKIVKVSLTPNMSEQIQDKGSSSLGELGLKHGDMIYIEATGASAAGASKGGLVGAGPKAIDAHGNLVASSKQVSEAFRPGLQSLRTQKLHWTLTDMVEFDNKYTFEIKGEQLSFCSSASLDMSSCNSFQMYLQNFGFSKCRCAYLYGNFVSGEEIVGSVEYQEAQKNPKQAPKKAKLGLGLKKYGQTKGNMKLSDLDMRKELAPKKGVRVHAIYEPMQDNTATEFNLLEDPREETVEQIAKALGLEKVGFMFAHPPREGYNFSSHEIINAGEQALEATGGKFDSPFVVVKVTKDEQGNGTFDAFSLTPQCLEMVAEDAILYMNDNPGHSAINETFTLIVEKKEAHVVDNDFFIKRVPILSHTSPYSGDFPRYNRPVDPRQPSQDALKQVLQKLGRNPSDVALAKALGDMQILIYLAAEVFDSGDGLLEICRFVASHTSVPPSKTPLELEEGYKLLLFSLAGIE